MAKYAVRNHHQDITSLKSCLTMFRHFNHFFSGSNTD